MIPTADIDVQVALDADQLAGASAASVVDGPACIHGYDPGFFGASTWADAEEITAREEEALGRVATLARDIADFDERAFEEGTELVHEFELGVCAACYALCAAGCPTFASCRGHDEGAVPWILFACDAVRARVLAECLSEAGCGAEVDDGHVRVWAPSLAEMIGLARAILRRQASFDALPAMVNRDETSGGDTFGW